MVMYIKDSGWMTKLTDMENTFIKMVATTRGNGFSTNSRAKDKNSGLTERNTKDSTTMAVRTD